MRTAVIRVNLNPAGDLDAGLLSRAVAGLRADGLEVIAPDFDRVPAYAREIELLLPGDDAGALRTWAEGRCAEALSELGVAATPDGGPKAGAATFLSRGTDEDALGVVQNFGITATLDRTWHNGEEVATFTITPEAAARVPESRLHTALEAALNCEVRIVIAKLSRRPPPHD